MPALVMKDGLLLLDSGQLRIADVAPGDPVPAGCCCGGLDCSSGCGYLDVSGPWGVWRINHSTGGNYADDGTIPGTFWIIDAETPAIWHAQYLDDECSVQLSGTVSTASCDGGAITFVCTSAIRYCEGGEPTPIPCPTVRAVGGCYAPCCQCCHEIDTANPPATLTLRLASWPYGACDGWAWRKQGNRDVTIAMSYVGAVGGVLSWQGANGDGIAELTLQNGRADLNWQTGRAGEDAIYGSWSMNTCGDGYFIPSSGMLIKDTSDASGCGIWSFSGTLGECGWDDEPDYGFGGAWLI